MLWMFIVSTIYSFITEPVCKCVCVVALDGVKKKKNKK